MGNSQVCVIAYIIFLHIWTYEFRWVELSWVESSPNLTGDIYNLIMYLIRYQRGFTALYMAASKGNNDITKLLIHAGADVNLIDSMVSDMIWEVVMTACVSDCFIRKWDNRVLCTRVSVTANIDVNLIILIYKSVQ